MMAEATSSSSTAYGGKGQFTTPDPDATFDHDLEGNLRKQRQVDILFTQLPWYERTLIGTHVTDMLVVGTIVGVAAIIWLFIYPSHPKSAVKAATALFLITAWIVTARMNYFVKKYLSLALKLYHDNSLEGLTAHLHAKNVPELSASAHTEESDKKWLGILPGHWAIYFKVATALVTVYQLGQPLLIPFRDETVIKKGFDIPVLNVVVVSNLDEFRIFYWVCFTLIALLWTATLWAFFIPMLLSEPWCIRYFKLFMQCLSIGIYETRELPACFSWHLRIFRFILRHLCKKLEEKMDVGTERPWTTQLFSNFVTLAELTFVPASMFLIKLVGCNDHGNLIELPSISCWTTQHVGFLFPGLGLLLCWYFLCVYAITWSVPLFSFENQTCVKFGWKPAFTVSEMVVWSPVFQYKALNLRMLLTMLAIIVGPTEPHVISILLVLVTLALFWSHEFIPTSDRYYPCNIASVNYWYGASLALLVVIAAETCMCVWLSKSSALLLDILIGVTIAIFIGIVAVFLHKRTRDKVESFLVKPLREHEVWA